MIDRYATRHWPVRLGLACGVAAPLVWLGVIALAGALTPGYEHLQDRIAALAARQSPTELLMRYAGYVLSGVLHVAFALALAWRSKFDWPALAGAALLALAGVARVLAGVHACDADCAPFSPSVDQLRHQFASGATLGLLTVSAIYWGVVSNRYAALKRLSAAGIGAGTWTLVFLVMSVAWGSHAGAWERLATATLSLWTFTLALAVYRAGVADAPLEPLSTNREAAT
jgi:hypothetical protein